MFSFQSFKRTESSKRRIAHLSDQFLLTTEYAPWNPLSSQLIPFASNVICAPSSAELLQSIAMTHSRRTLPEVLSDRKQSKNLKGRAVRIVVRIQYCCIMYNFRSAWKTHDILDFFLQCRSYENNSVLIDS